MILCLNAACGSPDQAASDANDEVQAGLGGAAPTESGCASGQQLCNGTCVPIDSDANCGACGQQCPLGTTCVAGVCSAAATGGMGPAAAGGMGAGGSNNTEIASGGAVASGNAVDTGAFVNTGGAAIAAGGASVGSTDNTGGAVAAAGGNTGSDTAAGVSGCGPNFWASAYDPTGGNGLDHQDHFQGQSCISGSCHTSSRPLLLAGTVYLPDGITGAANVQIGVKSGSSLHATYSGSSGNFWVQSGNIADFGSAQICVRTANGEVLKAASDPSGASCNGDGCHTSALRILAP